MPRRLTPSRQGIGCAPAVGPQNDALLGVDPAGPWWTGGRYGGFRPQPLAERRWSRTGGGSDRRETSELAAALAICTALPARAPPWTRTGEPGTRTRPTETIKGRPQRPLPVRARPDEE